MGNALSAIRAGAARLADDWVSFIATEDSADTTVLVDQDTGIENDHHFRGSELWFRNDAGTVANRGVVVRCLDSSRDMASVTIGPGLVSPPVVGDEAWAYNIGGEGTRIRTYDAYINDAIRSLGVAANPVYTETLANPWDINVTWVDIPAAFTHIESVQYLDANNNWAVIPSYGIAVDDVNKTFAIDGGFEQYANGYTIRMNGRQVHPLLVNDTDETDIDYEWLIYTVASRILMNKNDQLTVNRGGMYANAAEPLRMKAGPFSYSEGLIRVR